MALSFKYDSAERYLMQVSGILEILGPHFEEDTIRAN